jgi:Subtilase family
MPDTGTLAQALRPRTSVGAATSQGVAFQRVDKVQAKGINGRGITLGALSDSYDTATTTVAGDPLTIHAADDVASGDLPGPGNPRNRKPVVVVQDDPTGSGFDEGRGMLQIAHDVAPKAKLCFATAEGGDLNFADNIRKLADKSGPCGADVVVDDVSYFDEPFFSDGPIADAVDDVAAQGVSYFSSAGNEGDNNAWQSRVHLIPVNKGIKGTNLDFTDVPPELVSGGLQDMNPGPGVDVAQSLSLAEDGGIFDLQWDDPVDANGAQLGDPIYTATGELTDAQPEQSFEFTPTADQIGEQVQFRTDAIPSGTTDLILTVTAPDGTNLGTIDTGSSPESLVTTLNQAGAYTITIDGFGGDTGDFTIDVRPVLSPSKVTTDFNLLIFGPDGTYLGAVADNNPLTGRPFEVADLAGLPDGQIVISRAGTGPVGATRIRYVISGDIFQTEYSNPLATAIFGHHMAKGAITVAAYDPFRPDLPEYFTSPGGMMPVYFDSDGNRYARPQIRQKPDVASTDGGNTTFFVSDTARDPDTQPNFFGTSAAAPHAASIAALLLDKAGGPGSLTPSQVRRRLQHTTFAHDLDPNHSGGSAGGLTVSADGGQNSENDAFPGSMIDPKFFSVNYHGSVPLRSITFFGESASPTALGTRNPPASDGIVFDTRPFTGVSPFRDQGFPFAIGASSRVNPSSVSASFAVPGGGTAVAGQFRHMTLTFHRGLARGAGLQFGVDRDLAVSGIGNTSEGNGADELGGATFLPQRIQVPAGMRFTATRVDGKKIHGVIRNELGYGWTPLDGYGVVDAQRAVLGN